MDEEDIAFAGVKGQLAALESGEITSVALVEIVLRRIERINPLLNAFAIVLEDRARAEAELADRARAEGDRRPLLGLPIAVKDDNDVVGVVTGHGSAAFKRVAEADSVMVRRLREAGAIVVGKTTLPEFGQWPFTESTVSGITRNPWDPARTPGGIERRVGRCGCGGSGRCRHGERWRGLPPDPRGVLRSRRAQASTRPSEFAAQ